MLKHMYQNACEALDDDEIGLIVLPDSDEEYLGTLQAEIQEGFENIDANMLFIDQLGELATALESNTELSPREDALLKHGLNLAFQTQGVGLEQMMPSAAEETVSLESLKSAIATFWKAIVKAITNIVSTIIVFFKRLFGQITELKGTLGRLKKRAEKMSSAQATSKQTAIGGEVNRLMVADDYLTNGSRIERAVIEFSRQLNIIMGTYGTTVYDNGDNSVLLSNAEAYYDTVSKHYDKAANADSEATVTSSEKEVTAVINKTEASASKVSSLEISGGRKLVTNKKSDGDGDATSVKVKLESTSRAPGADGKIKTPSKGDLSTLVDDAIKLGNEIKSAKDNVKKLGETRKAAMDKAEKFIKDMEGGKVKEFWNSAMARKQLMFANRDMTGAVTACNGHAFTVARSALSFVESAAGNYKD